MNGPSSVRVLVACEFSGVVRDAFAARGFDAWSCDLRPAPGNHIQSDARAVITDGWDLMVAHPPCTYLSKAGARWMHPNGGLDRERYEKALAAKALFLELLNAPIRHVAVENPTPLHVVGLPPPTTYVEPYEYGEPYSKKTLLWLRNLPPLLPTAVMSSWVPWMPSNTGRGRRMGRKSHIVNRPWEQAVRFWPGIAAAMADQWGNHVLDELKRTA